jgi:RimJ/RimL family protein N-acetyltransferase
MEKVGFELININKKYRVVKGEEVDGYTLKLNLGKFGKQLATHEV